MRTKTKTALLLFVIPAMLLASCSNDAPETKQSAIILDATEQRMSFGDECQLTAIYEKDGTNEVIWSSTNESVVTVDSGKLMAVGIGSATVVASYKGDEASCNVTVTVGDYIPSLIISNVSGDDINLAKNDQFNIDAKVLYNNHYYTCDLEFEVENENIIESNSKNQILAKSVGSTNLKVSTKWNNFENALLCKSFKVTVSNNCIMYTNVTTGGSTKITSELELSIVENFAGKNYYSTAIIEPFCSFNGEKKNVEIFIEDDSIVSLDENNRVLTSKNVGKTMITFTYKDQLTELEYNSNLIVEVTSPIEIYDEKTVEFCTEDNFPITEYFGVDARIIKAYQNGKELEIKRGKFIEGIESNGSETNAITIVTNKGSYVFTNLYVYDRVITKDNIFSTFCLTNGRIIKGYYILKDDVIGADMTSQGESMFNNNPLTDKYFAGTFDGRGHTLSVKVALNGLFGGFGEVATVKNTHLHFDFNTPNPNQNCCGLARNASVYIKQFKVYLDNLYITASNMTARCYTIYDCKINDTQINNVYVDLTGSGFNTNETYTNSNQEIGCLYHLDTVLMNGPSSCFTGTVRNIHVVTGTTSFVPIGDAVVDNGVIYVTYARNDVDNIGNMGHHQASKVDTGYCIGKYVEGEPNKDYFGNLPTNLNGGPSVCWLYEGKSGKAEWGVYRYNTNADLKNSGITKIGDWTVND